MSYANREPVVMKDAISSGELNVGDWLLLNDGTGINNWNRYYQIVDVNASSNTAVLIGGVVKTDVNWRDYDEIRVYPEGDLDNYLTGSFYNSFPDEYKRILVPKSIAYTKLVERESGIWRPETAYISRSIFAPSASELGIESDKAMNEGATFQWFSGNVNAKSRRTVEGVTANVGSAYWTRTRNKASALLDAAKNYALYVKTNGDMDTCLKWNAKAVRVCLNITMNCIVSKNGSQWWLTPDLPPVFNPGTSQTIQGMNDQDILITWNEATNSGDPVNYVYADAKYSSGTANAVWYEVRERITQTYKNESEFYHDPTQSTTFTARYPYATAVERVVVSVRALDKFGNYSEWMDYRIINIKNNIPPNKPGTIMYKGRYKGESIKLFWAPGFDSYGRLDQDDNFAGYNVYRSVDGGPSTLIKKLQNEEGSTYEDLNVGKWNTVTYSIAAYDEDGAESKMTSVTITLYDRVTASLVVSDQSEIKCATIESDAPYVETVYPGGDTAHTIKFTLSDSIEGHTYSGLICFRDAMQNGIALAQAIENLELESGCADITFHIGKTEWQKIPNGTYAINCLIHDNENVDNLVSLDVYFKKACNHIYWEMSGDDAVIIAGETNIDSYFLNVDKKIPVTGFTSTVEVTRNATAASPDWRSATYNTGNYANFESDQAPGNSFGVRVHIERSTPGAEGDCFLSSVNGVFGTNVFSKIAAQIDAINTRIDGYHPAT